MSQVSKCSTCKQTFSTRWKASEHTRTMHQKHVTLKQEGGADITITRGMDGEFKCIIGNCTYSATNARYMHDHLASCDGVGPTPKNTSDPYAGTASVVPAGDEIELHDKLAKYNLMWNSRCHILICKKCHMGVPLKEVRGHYKAENGSCPWTKDQVSEDLDEYNDMITSSNVPPEVVNEHPWEPVQGLMLHNGFCCTVCKLSWPAKKTMKNHFSSVHGKGTVTYVTCDTLQMQMMMIYGYVCRPPR
ncbi:hypothetical protein DFH28DRAFT_918690 [Melampsora americana]|nr:hypothetical protein DFH28DRAFT_918690 [Melampsora americana]